jgi:nitrogen fixation NifU-like protein
VYDDLEDLYQQLIRDHYRRPHNRGTIEGADRSVSLLNPLCGDEIAVDLKLAGERVEDVRFHGQGCTISQASASMMTDLLKGKSLAEAAELIQTFKAMMRNEGDPEALAKKLGDLLAFQGVPKKYHQRIKCATLAWNAAQLALEGKTGTATTTGEGP